MHAPEVEIGDCDVEEGSEDEEGEEVEGMHCRQSQQVRRKGRSVRIAM